jgi:uncharacterized protein YggU (UPF0235/DUF167 family)
MARLPVKLTPGAAVDRIVGWEVDADGRQVLKAHVRARPVDGEANAALIQLVARALGIPRSSVSLARGGKSRVKMLEIGELDDAEARRRITDL